MAGETQSTDQKTVAGAYGGLGPEGSPIGDKSGNADEPNQLQPNEAIRVTPKPDEEGQADIISDPDVQTTGSKSGGLAPPATSKTH